MSFKLTKRLLNTIYYTIFVSGRQFLYFFKNGLLLSSMIKTDLTNNEKILLHQTLKRQKNATVCVEIGSYLGASACFISSALSRGSKLYCIDTWKSDNIKYSPKDPNEGIDTMIEFRKNTKKYKNKIIELRSLSKDAIFYLNKDQKIDFLFIDGNHKYRGVKTDWDLYSPLLHRGSLVAFHDTGWATGVKRLIHESVEKKADQRIRLPNMIIFKIRQNPSTKS